MTPRSSAVALVVLFACTAGVAVAGDDVVSLRVLGEAEGEDDSARIRALDAAFLEAVRRVSSPLVPAMPTAEDSRKIDAEVFRRARRFIVSYRVDGESRDSGRVEVAIVARVAVDRLRSTIESLGIGQHDGTRAVENAEEAPRAVVVGTWKHSGGATSLAAAGKYRSMVLSQVRELGLAISFDDEMGASALAPAELARHHGAGAVVEVLVDTQRIAEIRGAARVGGAAEVRLRVVDVRNGTDVVASAASSASAFAMEADVAAWKAGSEALRSAVESAQEDLERVWRVTPDTDGMVVAIAGVMSYPAVRAIERQFERSRAPVSIRRQIYGSGVIHLIVDSDLTADRLAAMIGSVRLPSARIHARARSPFRVDVRLRDFSPN